MITINDVTIVGWVCSDLSTQFETEKLYNI